MLTERFGTRSSKFPSRIRFNNRMVVIIKEHFSPSRFGNKRPRRQTNDFHDRCHLVFLIFTCKDRDSHQAFINYATDTPYIDSCSVPNAKHNLWSSIESRLDVSVVAFFLKATTPEINELYLRFIRILKEYILGLQVTVDYFKFEKIG